MSRRYASILAAAGMLALSACSGGADRTATVARSGSAAVAASAPAPDNRSVADRSAAASGFRPPGYDDLPKGPMGEVVRQGRAIFTDTPEHAGKYVGNGLSCSNCHLDAGRRADSAPLWGAWVKYPAYRAKNGHVNTFAERLQGCFRYSMNGTAPPPDSPEMVALQAYAYWMATGAPTGASLPGSGYPKRGFKPPQPPDYRRGATVFGAKCAICHGDDGQGRRAAGRYVFPPLWGPDSFNWGAGMHQLDNAAAFIKANMPFSRGGTLGDQEAWDVAYFMDAHERPQDPRFDGSVTDTRKRYHDTPMSLYGTEVQGHLLGSKPAGGRH